MPRLGGGSVSGCSPGNAARVIKHRRAEQRGKAKAPAPALLGAPAASQQLQGFIAPSSGTPPVVPPQAADPPLLADLTHATPKPLEVFEASLPRGESALGQAQGVSVCSLSQERRLRGQQLEPQPVTRPHSCACDPAGLSPTEGLQSPGHKLPKHPGRIRDAQTMKVLDLRAHSSGGDLSLDYRTPPELCFFLKKIKLL